MSICTKSACPEGFSFYGSSRALRRVHKKAIFAFRTSIEDSIYWNKKKRKETNGRGAGKKKAASTACNPLSRNTLEANDIKSNAIKLDSSYRFAVLAVTPRKTRYKPSKTTGQANTTIGRSTKLPKSTQYLVLPSCLQFLSHFLDVGGFKLRITEFYRVLPDFT